MRRFAYWFYVTLYSALAVAAALDPEGWDSLLTQLLDITLSVFTVVGLVAYARAGAHPKMISAWKAVAPLLIIGEIAAFFLNWSEFTHLDPELSVTENRTISIVVTTLFLAFILPALVVNVRFAQGRRPSWNR